MKVLIVHDREEAANEIAEVVAGIDRDGSVRVCRDVLGARDVLRQDHFDLMILDLTLPIELGDEPSLANAERLLRQVQNDPAAHSPGDILGITNDDAALALVKNSIGQLIMTSVAEDAADTWKNKVAEKVRYVIQSRRSREIVSRQNHDYDLGVITALDKEGAPYETLFSLSETEHRDCYRFNFRSKDGKLRKGMLLKSGRSGQAPAASDTQAFISLFRPKLMVMTGFCGGRQVRVGRGDLIAFTTSYAWDYGKWVGGEGTGQPTEFEPRPTPQSVEENGVDHVIRTMINRKAALEPELRQHVRDASGGDIDGWTVRRAAAASGSAVVTSEEVLARIKGIDENIYAIDMESYGFYLACRTTRMVRPDFICLKSVADFCNGQKDSKYHAACSLIAASYLKQIITTKYDF